MFRFSPLLRAGLLVVGSASLLLLAACGDRSSGDPADQPIIVGMDLSYPPFETIGVDGKPSGISVELAEALADFLNRPLRFENIPFAGLIPSLQTGKIDVVISSMTDKEERRQSIDFSDPYLSVGLALLAGSQSPVTGPEDLDLPDRTVVVRLGTTGEIWARENLKQARLVVLERENTAVLEVIQGKADAFIYDQMSVWKQAKQHPEATRALLTPLQTEHWAIGLRKGNEELRSEVNAFLQEFRAKGGFEELGNKYLGEQKQAFSEEGLEFFF